MLKVRSGRLSLSTMQPATLIVRSIGCTLYRPSSWITQLGSVVFGLTLDSV